MRPFWDTKSHCNSRKSTLLGFLVCVRGGNCVIGIWNPRFWIEIWVVKTKAWNYWNIFQLVVGVYLCSREYIYYNQHAMSSPARCYPKFTFFLQFFFLIQDVNTYTHCILGESKLLFLIFKYNGLTGTYLTFCYGKLLSLLWS